MEFHICSFLSMEIVTFVCVSVATPCIFLYRISFYFNNWFAFSPNPFVFLFIFVHFAISTTWRVSGVSA